MYKIMDPVSGSSPRLPACKTHYGKDPDTGCSRGSQILGGRGGKGFFVFKRIKYNELSAKGAYSAFRVETVQTTFSMATPKKLYSVESGIDLSSGRICGSVVDQHYCKNLFVTQCVSYLIWCKKFTARS